MTTAITVVVVFGIFGVLMPLAICSDSARREREQADARRRHPSNWVEVTDAAVVPLVCPVCLTDFGTAYLSQSGGTVGGWIELVGHECEKRVTV